MNSCDHALIQALNASDKSQLWICDENTSSQLISLVNPRENLVTLTNRYDIGEQLKSSPFNVAVKDFDFSDYEQVEQVVYRVSKERPLVQHCIAEAYKLLSAGGSLLLIGEKNDGLKTHSKFAETLFSAKGAIEKNGLSYTASIIKQSTSKNTQHNIDPPYHQLQIIKSQGQSFYSKPGLYGWKKIDVGSQLLVDIFKASIDEQDIKNKSVLDLGCGYGFLTLEAAKLGFKTLYATDNNVAAITAAEKNFACNKLEVSLSLDDCGKNINQRFDYVLCNPPFHQGFSHDKSLIEQFLRQSLKLLKPQGSGYFVTNEFIPLVANAEEIGFSAQRLHANKGFRVYKITH